MMNRVFLLMTAMLAPVFYLNDNTSTLIVDKLKTNDTPLFNGLGHHSRKVTDNLNAQKYFDQGLNFLFAFNHDESRKSFQKAVELAPECAMAHWGVAISNGSHINKTVVKPEQEKQALTSIAKAQLLMSTCSDANRALIKSLAMRFADNAKEDRTPLNSAYSKAMKQAWEQFPQDADIGALYAESMMNLRPWDLWTNNGQPQAETMEIISVLDAVLKVHEYHPLALHLYIHAVEASPNPQKGELAADRLRNLQPGLGHMVHMPSHIDVRTGRWQLAIEANERAIRADADYRKLSPKQEFYHLYMAHNHHMLAFAAMMSGQSKKALEAVRTMLAGVPPEWVSIKENALIADGFLAAPLEVMMRFGQWESILNEPELPTGFPIARTFRLHARSVALAALGKVKEAREEQKRFRESVTNTPKEATFGNNTSEMLFAVADAMLEGEILYREGKIKESIQALQLAVEKEDQLRYDEPPDWIIPVRHPLAAILLKTGQVIEAEKVYRDDLKRWPHNGWSLYGLMKCLKSQGRDAEAVAIETKWQQVWKHADIQIESSCKCIEK